jgi:hypothetical protein
MCSFCFPRAYIYGWIEEIFLYKPTYRVSSKSLNNLETLLFVTLGLDYDIILCNHKKSRS